MVSAGPVRVVEVAAGVPDVILTLHHQRRQDQLILGSQVRVRNPVSQRCSDPAWRGVKEDFLEEVGPELMLKNHLSGELGPLLCMRKQSALSPLLKLEAQES